MVYRYAAVALLAGLGCYRAPRIPSPAVTDLGCVYDPVTEQLRVCLEPSMLGACATFGPKCRGRATTAERDLDVPVYKASPHYVPRVEEPVIVEPVPPQSEAVLAAPIYGGDFGYVGYVGGAPMADVGVGGGAGGGGGVDVPPPVAPPSRPPPPPHGRPPVTGVSPVPPRPQPEPPGGRHPRPPRPGVVVTQQPPLDVPPVGRPTVTAEEPGSGGPVILRPPPGGRVIVVPQGQQLQHGQAPQRPPPRRVPPRKR